MSGERLPDWCYKGGFFRPSLHCAPSKWYKKKGRWRREYVVPYGKASEEYREKYYRCPECESLLEPSWNKAYTFVCPNCSKIFRFGWGALYEAIP